MPRGRRTLLLADDSPTIRKVISLTFNEEGLEVIAVGDGGEALRRMEEGVPDIVLADAVMPGIDGYELCERIKNDARFSHVPVMLLVGTFEPFNEAEARRVGADTVLTKPFQSIRDLVSKVGSLIGGGESKHAEDEEANRDAPRRSAAPFAAEETLAREADIPARPRAPEASAPTSPSGEPGAAFGGDDRAGGSREHAPSFADIEMDDLMIEERPAEAFGVAADAGGRPVVESADFEPGHFGADAFEADAFREEATHDVFKTRAEMFDESRAASVSTAAATPRESGEASAAVAAAARPSFAARVADAAAADESLLDLGDDDAPGGPANTDYDDFVLDLADDSPSHFQPARVGSWGAETPLSAEPEFGGASARPDAAGAFAEAAHGDEPSRAEFSAAPRDYSPAPPEVGWGEPTATEVVTRDAPQTQGTRDEPQSQAQDVAAADAATPDESREEGGMSLSQMRGAHEFIEPRVVPADVPAPSEAGEEFTDGSVEGDVAKSPAAPGPFDASRAPGTPHAAEAAAEASAAETSSDVTSGSVYAHDASARGAESAQSSGELSPEAVDAIARRVVELMSEKVVREIAWEVVPDLAELLIKRRLDEERGRN